jgi:hypothetical protein
MLHTRASESCKIEVSIWGKWGMAGLEAIPVTIPDTLRSVDFYVDTGLNAATHLQTPMTPTLNLSLKCKNHSVSLFHFR